MSNDDVDADGTTEADDKEDDVEAEVDEDEDVSSMLSSVSSILQGFAFQHHSTSNEPIKLFPIVLKAEY